MQLLLCSSAKRLCTGGRQKRERLLRSYFYFLANKLIVGILLVLEMQLWGFSIIASRLSPAQACLQQIIHPLGSNHHDSGESVSGAKYDGYSCFSTGIHSELKPTANNGAVLCNVRSYVVPSMSVVICIVLPRAGSKAYLWSLCSRSSML